ncbi:MAG: DEAD/DEAH box helicase [Deltaproteobacteria bacterium]|nr:DEAD/DEAH box helicase [Deltaproteobacteria bacterium]
MTAQIIDFARGVIRQQLEGATTLPQLSDLATRHGWSAALEQPWAVLGNDDRTDPAVIGLLRELETATGVQTLAELCQRGKVQGTLGNLGSPALRDRLVQAVKRHVERAAAPDAPPAAPGPVAAKQSAPRGPIPEDAPQTRAELERWAEAHGIRETLDQALTSVLGHEGRPFYEFLSYGANLHSRAADALLGRLMLPLWAGKEAPRALAAATWRALQAEARVVEQGAAEEAQRAARGVPETLDAVLREFLERVAEARARIRETARPRPGAALIGAAFDGEGDALLAISLQLNGTRLPPVHLPLGRWRTQPLQPVNAWTRERHHTGDADGVRALAALDALHDFIVSQPADPKVTALADFLRTPAWSRTLRQLRRAREEFETARAPREALLSWRVQAAEDGVMDLRPVVHKRIKKGWSAGAAAVPGDRALLELPSLTPLERRVLEKLAASEHNPQLSSEQRHAARLETLELLVGHPRVELAALETPQRTPVELRHGRLTLVATECGDGAIRLSLALDGQPLDAARLGLDERTADSGEVFAVVEPAEKRIRMVRIAPDAQQMLRVLARHETEFPVDAHAELLAFASLVEDRLPIELPPGLTGDQVPADTTVVARLEALEGGVLSLSFLVRPLADGRVFRPGEGAPVVYGTQGDRRVHARRDLDGEAHRVREVAASLPLPPESEDPRFVHTLAAGEEALDLVSALQDRAGADLAVEWSQARWRVSRRARLKDVRVQVARKRDWLGVQGEVEVDGVRVAVAAVLDAVRRGRRFVAVDEHTYVALGDELRARMAAAADHVHGGGPDAHVGVAGALALQDLKAELGELRADPAFAALVDRAQRAGELAVAPSGHLRGVLRDYQVDGFAWLARLAAWEAGACLADEMGLGKTLQALALLEHRAPLGPALVLAPTSVCRNWRSEAERFTPGLRVSLYRETPDGDREAAVARAGPGDVLVVSHGMAAREVERLAAREFATLVVDEAQALKNAATKRARAAHRLQAGFRVALTGTPVENHLGELWSVFRVAFPGLFGSWDEFRDRFAGPIEKQRDESRRRALGRLLRPFLLRRTKAQVAPELPPRTQTTEYVELTAAERRLYEQARLAAVAEMGGLADETEARDQRFQILAALTRLRLCACHPRLYDAESTAPSAKLTRLMEIVDELLESGQRALVFSQFTSHLALVRERLDAQGIPYLYLDGQTPAHRRDELVKTFQAGAGGPLFLISLKAGGSGLNLTAASYVLHLDPWWNPAVEDQASDRAHRIGQDKPVTIIRLVARGTVEEQILSLHEDKRALLSGVLEGSDAVARLSPKELLDIIRAGDRALDDDDADEDGPAPAAGGWPAALGGSAERFNAQLDALLQTSLATTVSPATPRAYDRSLRRFAAYVAGRAALGGAAELALSTLARDYLQAVKDGAVDAPASEFGIARSALKRLAAFVAMG